MATLTMSMPDHKNPGLLARLVSFLRRQPPSCAHAEGWVTWPYDGRLQFCPACGKLDDKPRMAA
jgi:hypothetical protein